MTKKAVSIGHLGALGGWSSWGAHSSVEPEDEPEPLPDPLPDPLPVPDPSSLQAATDSVSAAAISTAAARRVVRVERVGRVVARDIAGASLSVRRE
ncbi:MAG TPA: hypothetical protein VK640_08115 [Actinomycetes bacterium]|nr:hypothetical protein [Actinomycetes bacterium]